MALERRALAPARWRRAPAAAPGERQSAT